MSIDISVIGLFIRGFPPQDMDHIWHYCPNRMLWEAIHAEDAEIVSHTDILTLVKQTSEVYVLPELLPAFYHQQNAACSVVSSYDFAEGFSEYIKTEPLYVFHRDFSWMVVFTTENTPDGEQLCILVKNAIASEEARHRVTLKGLPGDPISGTAGSGSAPGRRNYPGG